MIKAINDYSLFFKSIDYSERRNPYASVPLQFILQWFSRFGKFYQFLQVLDDFYSC